MQLMLALFFIAAGAGAVVSRTPNSLTPPPPERAGQVRELWPLLLQCEHRRVIVLSGGGPPARANTRGRVGFRTCDGQRAFQMRRRVGCSALRRFSLLSEEVLMIFWEYLKGRGETK
jgi:hypothetical protein